MLRLRPHGRLLAGILVAACATSASEAGLFCKKRDRRSSAPVVCYQPPTVLAPSCNSAKRALNERFNWTKFGSCSHPTAYSADVEAAALGTQLALEHPGAPIEYGHKTVTAGTYNTFLAYAGAG